jgi:hypothetical protein
MPGGFPSEEPQQVQEESAPPQEQRASSSSNASPISSISSNNDWQHPTESRSRPSSTQQPGQQPSKLVPFPVPEYHHHSTEPYQYQMAGQVVPPASSSYATSSQQPPPMRRVPSGPADSNYTVMPRRVPVPIQRANAPVQAAQGSYSDAAIAQRGFGIRGEVSDGEEDPGGIVVGVAPQVDERSYKVQTVKPVAKGGDGAGGGRANERRRRATHTKKKT